MRSRTAIILMLLAVFSFPAVTAGASGDKEKDQLKIALDDLKNEVVLLERQVRAMQESMDRNNGQMSTLINQIGDNVAAIRQAQGRVAESAMSATSEVNGLGERITSTNTRLDQLSEQIAQLKHLVENMPKAPTFTQITPGNPDQLFAAAYGDYSRGNYDLAISEFRQYVETYPTSEMADNAQYWIGECYFAKNQFPEAVTEFDKVSQLFPRGDKVPAAKFKKGMALLQMNQPDAARAEFAAIIKLHPRSNEATLARQQLDQQPRPQQ